MIYRVVQQCARSLGNLQVCLEKAVQHAAAKKFDVNILLTSRLAPDQHHFIYQVQSACDYVKGAAAWLSGQAPPKHEDNEKTLDEVRERIRKTIDFVESVKEDQYAGASERKVKLSWAPGELTMVVGFVMLVLIGYNGLIDKPGNGPQEIGVSLDYGYWLALLGSIAIAATGFLRSQVGQKRERKAPGTV